MSQHGLGGAYRYLIGVFTEGGFYGSCLHLVIKLGGGAMGVDVVNIGSF